MKAGFFIFDEVTVFLARKASREEIKAIVRETSEASKRAYSPLPVHCKVNIRYVDSNFKISTEGKGNPQPEASKATNGMDPGRIPKGFNRRTVPVQI